MANPFDQFDNALTNPFDQFDPPPASAPTARAEKETLKEASWIDDPVMASRAFLDGIWLGWSDEIGASVAAGVAKLGGDEAPYGEIYNDIYGALAQEKSDYAEQFPVASTALEVAGSFASPATFAKLPAAASVASKPVQQVLGGIERIAPGVASQAIGRAGVEGAIAGAGFSEEGERAQGVALGTVFGLSAGGAIAGGAKGLDIISRRRVTQELGRGADFLPINIAAGTGEITPKTAAEALKTPSGTEGFLSSFYRDVVGKTFGGQGALARQAEPLRNRLALQTTKTEEILDKTTRNAADSLKQAKKAAAQEARSKAGERAAQIEEQIGDVRARPSSAVDTVDEIKLRTTYELDRAVNEAEGAFRTNALNKSIPEGTPQDEIDNILQLPIHDAMQRVDELWSTTGFDMLKNRTYKANVTDIMSKINRQLKDDPLVEVTLAFNTQPGKIQEVISGFLSDRITNGTISGDDMSALRSKLGQIAGAKTDAGGEGAVIQSIFRSMQDVLNDTISSQLTPLEKAAFDAQRKQWQTNLVLRKAVTSASRKAGRDGQFSPDEWVTNAVTLTPRGGRQGNAPLQAEANRIASMSKQRDQIITERANDFIQQIKKTKERETAEQMREVAQLRAQKKRDLVEINRKRDAGIAKQAMVLGKKQEIAELENTLGRLKAQQAAVRVSDVKPTSELSLFERLFASGLLGHGYGTVNILTGSALGRTLATQRAQRIVAGQSRPQQAMHRGLQAIAPVAPGFVGAAGGAGGGQVAQ